MQRSERRVSKTEVVSDGGMVTAMHPLAADAGAGVLEAGGNAADAAIATAFANGVVEPYMSGVGGAAYAVAYDASRQSSRCFDGSAVVPAGATPDMFPLAEESGKGGLYGWPATHDDASETGYRAIVVPGAVAALARLHEWMGSRPWEELVEPAIRLASDGFPVDEHFFIQSALSESRLRLFPDTMARFFRRDGSPFVPGGPGEKPDQLKQPELARTLRAIAKDGAETFYRGPIGKEIAAHVSFGDGVLTEEDLASYEARSLEPLRLQYRDLALDVLPGTSGGPTVALALRILDGFDLESLPQDDPGRLHLVAEALRLCFAQRFQELGALPDEGKPLEAVFAPDAVERRRARIDPAGRCMSSPLDGVGPAPSGDARGQHTTHLNAVDGKRNMVSLTATLGARFGSGVSVPGHGIVLNNGFMWFDPEPGHPQSIRPGKRALHAAAPTLLFSNGEPRGCLGSPGARRIMSAVLQVILHLADQKLGPQAAIEAPRLHCETAPELDLDARFPRKTVRALARRGFSVTPREETFLSSFFARPTGILVHAETGLLHGGAEPYRGGTAVGL